MTLGVIKGACEKVSFYNRALFRNDLIINREAILSFRRWNWVKYRDIFNFDYFYYVMSTTRLTRERIFPCLFFDILLFKVVTENEKFRLQRCDKISLITDSSSLADDSRSVFF